MKANPRFVAIYVYLLVGLIWSEGHIAWLIALGAFIFFEIAISSLYTWMVRS